MRRWVKPFLREMLNQRYHKWPDRKKKIEGEIGFEYGIWHGLTDCFIYNFGVGLGTEDFLIGAFGSVLSDIPKKVFEELRRKQNVFYIHTPNDGAEVKVYWLDKGIRKGERLSIVNFPYISEFMPSLAVRGEIVHELAHIYREDPYNTFENDVKTDKLAQKWGFQKEIKAMRDYYKELGELQPENGMI